MTDKQPDALALAKRDKLAHRGNRLRAEERANWECAQHLRDLLAALDAAQGERGLSSWIINNLLNESQLDVVPPGCDRALRYLDQPQAPPVEWFVQWIRNNYQNHPNIASLCDAMLAAARKGNDNE